MTWEKTWSVICDQCSCGIDHYPDHTLAQAIKVAKDVGTVSYAGKHFCDEDCLLKYKISNGIPL